MMSDDFELLRRYTRHRDEAAFAELVACHVDLVFGTAVRRLGGNRSAAEDVVQSVFADLAARAPTLAARESLAGWLHRSTCFAASKFLRSEARRARREEKTLKMADPFHLPEQEPAWAELEPIIDDALNELPAPEREAILLPR